jgi:hypothetical protein
LPGFFILAKIAGPNIFPSRVRVSGLTEVGRATVHVLDLNDARRVELRAEILKRSHLA